MNELALFAGAGGGVLGGHLLGWRTLCAVEVEPYPASVLCTRQNDGLLPPFPIWDDVRTFQGKPWRGLVDVVSGGFPCQDISSAGKGAGIEGGGLASVGFNAEWDVFGADDVGAPHIRKRMWILAYTDCAREQQSSETLTESRGWTGDGGETV